MKNKKTLMFLIVLFLLIASLSARDITLDEAVSLAVNENLQIKTADVDLQMAKVAYDYSYNTVIPTVNAMAVFKKNNPENSPVIFTYGISGSWNFNPAVITAVSIAKQTYLNGEISYEKACAQVINNVRKLYFGIVLQEESLSIQKATLESQKEKYLQAQRDYERGLVPQLYMLQNHVTYENSKPAFEKAQVALDNAKRQFAFLLGLDTEEKLNLTTSIECEMVDIDVNQALSSIAMRYDILAIEKQEQILKLNKAAIIESTFLPSISLSASWQPALGNISKKVSNSNPWVDTGSLSGTIAWNLTNILPSSSQYKNLSDIKNGLKKIELGKTMAEENARIEILNLIATLNQTRSSIESSEETIALAQANYDMTIKSYEAGSSDYLDVKDAQNQLDQAKLGKLSNQYNYISSLIDLEYATGQKIF